MNSWLQWLNTNSAAIQAASTVVLVAVTSWYAVRTHQLTSITNEQLKLIRRSQEPELTVSLCNAFAPMNTGQVLPTFTLTAANSGLLPLTVDVPYIQLPDRRTLVFTSGFLHSEVTFPHRLDAGESCTVLLDVRELISGLERAGFSNIVNIQGAYRDKVGTTFLSKPYEFEPRAWMRRLEEARA